MLSSTCCVCVHLCGTPWLVVCGRLFELDPELLSLFHYTTNCGSTQDCLSSPEFLEHVTKVSSVRSAANDTFSSTVGSFLLLSIHL